MKKKTVTLPKDKLELQALVTSIATAQLEKESLVAERDLAVIEAVKPFVSQIEDKDKSIAEHVRLLKAWAVANRAAEFPADRKSMKVLGHAFGWESGNPATGLEPGVDWEDVTTQLQALRDLGESLDADQTTQAMGVLASHFLRDVIEPNKAEMLARRDDPASLSLLKGLGVKIGASEKFFFRHATEDQTSRTEKA